jgi:hypothetical protein
MDANQRARHAHARSNIVYLEIAKFAPRADSTAGDARSRESGHRTPMPNGTTRHQ